MQQFQDQVIIIIGGATGIGFSVAQHYGAQGARILLGDHPQSPLDEAVATLSHSGIDARGIPCDVADWMQLEALAHEAWQSYGHVDLLCHFTNLKLPTSAPLLHAYEVDLRDLFDAHVFQVWNCCSIFSKHFIAQGSPATLYTIAPFQSHTSTLQGTSTLSHHAQHSLIASLNHELPESIKIERICPSQNEALSSEEAYVSAILRRMQGVPSTVNPMPSRPLNPLTPCHAHPTPCS